MAAGQLVATTDPGVIRRMVAGSPASHGLPVPVVPVMTAREVAFTGMVDVVLPMVLFAARDSFDGQQLVRAVRIVPRRDGGADRQGPALARL